MRGRLIRQGPRGIHLGVALLAPGALDMITARDLPLVEAGDPETASLLLGERRAIRRFVIDAARPLGVIATDLLGREDAISAECRWLFAAPAYWRTPSPAAHAQARSVLLATAAVADGRALALANAHLAFLAIAEHRELVNPLPGDPRDRAMAHARAAVDGAPSSARAHHALMDALFVRGEPEAARAAAERAMMLNPYDMDVFAAYGAWLVQTGQVAAGREKLLAAAATLASRPPWQDFYLVLSALLLDDQAAAQAHAELVVSDADRMSLLLRILAADARNDRDALSALAAKLSALDRMSTIDTRMLMARRGFAPFILERLNQIFDRALGAG